MKTYCYKKQIVTLCILLGASPFVINLIAYIVTDPWTDFDTRASIWILVTFLFLICIALISLVGRRYVWDCGMLYLYHGDRMLWKAEIQYGQAYAQMLTAPKAGRFIYLVYDGDDKIYKRTISGCDNLSDLYVELYKYNDPNMPEKYPKKFKLLKNMSQVPYEDVVQSMKK